MSSTWPKTAERSVSVNIGEKKVSLISQIAMPQGTRPPPPQWVFIKAEKEKEEEERIAAGGEPRKKRPPPPPWVWYKNKNRGT
jgi:hypothetical protein